jgi:hypothetical protein
MEISGNPERKMNGMNKKSGWIPQGSEKGEPLPCCLQGAVPK